MEKTYKRARLGRPFRQHLRRGARLVFGLCVMGVAVLALVWLFGREEQVRFRGIVDAGAENVGPVENARIVSIDVVPGQRVKAGDVLVRFDPTARLAEEALNEVKIRESEQNAARSREGLEDERRRCRQAVREASVALEERRMERLREEAELAALEAELARLKPLVERKLVSALELTALRPKADALRKTVGGYEPLLRALKARLEQAEADERELTAQLAAQAGSGAPTNATLAAALRRYEDVRRADPSVLKALSDGIVSQIFRRAGDTVPAGEAVVRLAALPEARFVTGMLAFDHLDDVHVGDELTVSRLVVPGRGGVPVTARARVETIDPEVLDFFDPMNTAPRSPVRGRKVRIRLTGGAEAFIPGESVLIEGTGATGLVEILAQFFRLRGPGAS